MKNKKIGFSLLISVICIFFVLNFSVLAEEDVVVNLQIDNPIMEINGIDAEIDAGRGTAPVILNGRTLVPVRAIIEAFDGEVEWNNETQTVVLTMENDVIWLTIDSYTAYYNGVSYYLDTAPCIVNSRTMLPIRFIAEKFNLGVAWNNSTRTVTLVRNGFDDAEYSFVMCQVPQYSGSSCVTINNNVPMFKSYEKIPASFEFYANLDELGRCDVAMASVAPDIMPTGERGNISSVIPTGWINKSYDIVPGGYLYNRCHLIGYQLTGENANAKNLITGTRYLNIDGMLDFENAVDDYVDATGNHVMYRVTPVFENNNLVAEGVLMEAYSVEDNGKGISFCVFCYNVQPGVAIDYATGESYATGNIPETSQTANIPSDTYTDGEIYRTPTGKRYHLDPDCGGKNSYSVTIEDALATGLTPCQKCAK